MRRPNSRVRSVTEVGGSIGIALGLGLSKGVTAWMTWPTEVSPQSVAEMEDKGARENEAGNDRQRRNDGV